MHGRIDYILSLRSIKVCWNYSLKVAWEVMFLKALTQFQGKGNTDIDIQ